MPRRIDNGPVESHIRPSAAAGRAQPAEARPGDYHRNVQTAGKIAMNAFGNNFGGFRGFRGAPQGLRAGAKRGLLRVLRPSIRDEIKAKTAAAVDIVRHQPEVQRIIDQTSVPTSDMPHGNIQLQRNDIQGRIVDMVDQLTPAPHFDWPQLERPKWVEYVPDTERMGSVISTVAKGLTG